MLGLTRPNPGELLHFSEDEAIEEFVPHVAETAQQSEAYVWAVHTDRCPDYWFPRDCPRAMAWVTPSTTQSDASLLGVATRVHVIEYGWLPLILSARLYAYRLPADSFRPFELHAHVATEAVRPLGPPEPVGDLLAAHLAAGIELRLVDNVWPFWRLVAGTTLGHSGIRLRNALPEARG